MPILNNVLEAIGHTPMVRLRRLPEKGSAEIVVKLESVNPGGSIKARPAFRMIAEAEKADLIDVSGDRSVGGLRASIYNAMPVEGVQTFVNFMKKFRDENP